MIIETENEYWTWIKNPENLDLNRMLSGYPQNGYGKYLFFSEDRSLLLYLLKTEIEKFGFASSKVCVTPKAIDYVACLYWYDNSRSRELAARNYGCRGPYWKTDEDTLAGVYSK